MKMNAAVLWEIGQEWCVEEVDLDPPAEGEVLVSFTASGLCHSDHHIRAGDLPGLRLPVVGGYEGSGWSKRSAQARAISKLAITSSHRFCPHVADAGGAQQAARICATWAL